MGSQAFDAKRGNLWWFWPENLIVIGVDTKDGPEHELYDERVKLPLDENMICNMMLFGVKQSVTIRKEAGRAEVVDGRRRVLHAREANKRLGKAGDPLIMIPATLERGDGHFMSRVAISLNELRVDDHIVTRAEKAVRLLQRNGGDVEDAAVVFGVSAMTIRNWAKLVELAPKVRKAVQDGGLSASAAIQLHGLEKEQQVAELDGLMASAKKNGKPKATANNVRKATGKTTAPGKRVLMKLVTDEKISSQVDAEVVYGIKLALGEHLPGPETKLGHLLTQAGYVYDI